MMNDKTNDSIENEGVRRRTFLLPALLSPAVVCTEKLANIMKNKNNKKMERKVRASTSDRS